MRQTEAAQRLEAARQAQSWWGRSSVRERSVALAKLRAQIASRVDEVVEEGQYQHGEIAE